MFIPSTLIPSSCDIFRPFGSGSPTHSNIPCRLSGDFARSRQSVDFPNWTHYMLVDADVDILDGCSRTAGSNAITYADGDEVRIPAGAASPRYVVVWVESVEIGTNREHKRVYLMRHQK